MSAPVNPFDLGPEGVAEYDAWYDSADGKAALDLEERCVGDLLAGAPRPWLDVGTGTGRFGGDRAADIGLDPSPQMLRLASRRIPSAVLGVAEALPFRDASIGGVLCVAVLEFVPAPDRALAEMARVLRPGGRAVVGFFPREGPWALTYSQQGQDPGSVFHGSPVLFGYRDARAGRRRRTDGRGCLRDVILTTGQSCIRAGGGALEISARIFCHRAKEAARWTACAQRAAA